MVTIQDVVFMVAAAFGLAVSLGSIRMPFWFRFVGFMLSLVVLILGTTAILPRQPILFFVPLVIGAALGVGYLRIVRGGHSGHPR